MPIVGKVHITLSEATKPSDYSLSAILIIAIQIAIIIDVDRLPVVQPRKGGLPLRLRQPRAAGAPELHAALDEDAGLARVREPPLVVGPVERPLVVGEAQVQVELDVSVDLGGRLWRGGWVLGRVGALRHPTRAARLQDVVVDQVEVLAPARAERHRAHRAHLEPVL